MGCEPLGGVSIRIVDQNVGAVVLLEPLPLLIGVDVKIENIEFLQMLLTNALGSFVSFKFSVCRLDLRRLENKRGNDRQTEAAQKRVASRGVGRHESLAFSRGVAAM
jgi:hypothetical protein